MRRICLGLFVASLLSGIAAAQAQPASGDVVLVLDVSNSMWGRIDEVSKIEIAREVIAELLEDWDPGVDLGLVAYGHRRERDCGDIELVVPVGPVDPPAFVATVNSLVPRGRTPLTEAVRLAAETLGYRGNPATVVLLSDGVETCDADPCALAAELERTGVSFIAHVIGFDVAEPEAQAQLSCIAESTGGVYLAAANAAELSAALADVAAQAAGAGVLEQAPPPDMQAAVEEPVEAVPEESILLEVIDDTTGAVLDAGVTWTVVAVADQRTVLEGGSEARPELSLPAGAYVATAETALGTGEVAFTVVPGAPSTQRVHLASPVAAASLSIASPSFPMSRPFDVGWDGPDAADDFVTIVPPDAEEGAQGNLALTASGDPAVILAPDRPGTYELRYVSGATQDTLASLSVTILEVPASVSSPATVTAGSTFAVTWQGPDGPGDMIVVAPVGAAETYYAGAAYTAGGTPATLRAADIPGDYEIRYVSAQSGIVLASQPVRLEAQATLAAPREAVAGSRVAVAWTGPANPDDRIVVAAAGAGEGEYLNHAPVADGSPADLLLPDAPGAYEIRYMTGQEKRTLAAIAITLVPPPVTLDAPDEAVSGSAFQVAWTGPDNENDRIVVVPAGAAEGDLGNSAFTRDGAPATLTAPDMPGAYEVRYMSGGDSLTLATRSLAVLPVPARIEAPASVVAGARFEVAWTGPDNPNDRIAVVAAGAAEGQFDTYAYTADGAPSMLAAPDTPGAYEVRYLTGQDLATLARMAITVEAAPATLQAPVSVGAGGQFEIVWSGPANSGDMVVVSAVGAPATDYFDFFFVDDGTPGTLSAPDEPGAYELRYLTGQDDTTLAAIPLTVTAVTATLLAPAAVSAGEPFEVTWTGPANHYEDRIVIVEAGSEAGYYLSYAFAQDGSPATLIAPGTPGAYELRYMTGRSGSTLAAAPIEVR